MTERAFRRLALAALATSLTAVTLASPVLAQQTTVRIWTPQTAGYQEWIEWANTAIKEVDPTLDIVLETFPNEPYKTMVQVGAASEDGPDIFFNWAGEVTASMVRDGLVLDISAFGDGDDGYKASIPASLLGFFAYDGKQYGVPMQAVTKYFYYNTAKFEELGLAVPQTMGQLIEMCGTIRTVDPSLTPISIGNSGPWQTVHYMTMLNERVLGVAGTAPDYDLSNADDALFTNPGYVQAWQILADMRDAGCFQPAPNATTPEAGEAMFTAEVALMNYCGSWCTSIFNAEGFGGKYGMFRMPAVEGGAGDPNANFLVPEGFQVSARTPNPEATMKVLNFLVSGTSSAEYLKATKIIPANGANFAEVETLSAEDKWIVDDVASLSAGVGVLDVSLKAAVAQAYLDGGSQILGELATPEQVMEAIRAAAIAAKAAQ